MLKFDFSLTLRDVVAAQFLSRRPTLLQWPLYIAVFLLLIMGVSSLAYDLPGHTQAEKTEIAVLWSLLGIAFLLVFQFGALAVRAIFLNYWNRESYANFSIAMDDDGIAATIAGETFRLGWERLRKWKENGRLIQVYFDDKNSFWLTKSSMPADGVTQLKAMLRERIGKPC